MTTTGDAMGNDKFIEVGGLNMVKPPRLLLNLGGNFSRAKVSASLSPAI